MTHFQELTKTYYYCLDSAVDFYYFRWQFVLSLCFYAAIQLQYVCVCVHQVVLTISQMMWCRDMDACLEGDHDHFAALQEFELTNFDVNHTLLHAFSFIVWL